MAVLADGEWGICEEGALAFRKSARFTPIPTACLTKRPPMVLFGSGTLIMARWAPRAHEQTCSRPVRQGCHSLRCPTFLQLPGATYNLRRRADDCPRTCGAHCLPVRLLLQGAGARCQPDAPPVWTWMTIIQKEHNLMREFDVLMRAFKHRPYHDQPVLSAHSGQSC